MKVKYIGPYETARLAKYDLNDLRIGDIREVSEEDGKEIITLNEFTTASGKAPVKNANYEKIKADLELLNMSKLRAFAKQHKLKAKDNDKETLRKELLAEIKLNGGL